MVSSYYGNYGYGGGYGYSYGNPQQSDSMLGDTSMSGAYSSIGAAPEMDPANVHGLTKGITQTYNDAMKPQQQKSGGGLFGGIGDFFKGIVNGATNLVKSLADPKTWLMIGAAALLCFLFPPAGFALLAIGGVMAGSQILKGVSSGNMEQVGEGVFNLGATAVGAKGMGGAVGDASVSATRAAEATSTADEAVMSAGRLESDVAAGGKASSTEVSETQSLIADGENSASKVKGEPTQMQPTNAKLQEANTKLNGAMEAQARNEVQGLNQSQRQSLIDSQPKVATKLSEAQGEVNTSLDQLNGAKAKVSELEAAGKTNTEEYQIAQSNLKNAQTKVQGSLKQYRDLQYQNIKAERAKTVQNMKGFGAKARDYWQGLKQSTGENIDVLRGKRLTRTDGSSRTLYNSTFKSPEEIATGKTTTTGESGGFFSGLKNKATGLKDRFFGGGSKTAPKTEPNTSTTPKPNATTTEPETVVHTKIKQWESATPQQRVQMEQDPEFVNALKDQGFKVKSNGNVKGIVDDSGVGVYRRQDGTTLVKRPDGSVTMYGPQGNVVAHSGIPMPNPRTGPTPQTGPTVEEPVEPSNELVPYERPTGEGPTGQKASDETPVTDNVPKDASNEKSGMFSKVKGWFKPGEETTGFAGYKNYLLTHKSQSWLQGYTAFNPIFGGQPGQQGQQGGGLLNFGGLLGGGGDGQGAGLLG